MTKIDDEVAKQYECLMKQSKGAFYYSADLHIHTPGSKKDYKVTNRLARDKYYEKWTLEEIIDLAHERGMINEGVRQHLLTINPKPDKDNIMAELIVFEALKKRLDLIVIADHNTISWYEIVKEAAKKRVRKPFTILPGAEITCYGGTHIIAIFNLNNSSDHWKQLSRILDFDDEVQALEGPITIKSEIEVVQAIHKVGALSYIPHLDNNDHGYTIKSVLKDITKYFPETMLY